MKPFVRDLFTEWKEREPLLYAVLRTHEVVYDESTSTLRVAKGLLHINPDYLVVIEHEELMEDLLTNEVVRIFLKHPYTQRPIRGPLAYYASNIAIRETYCCDVGFPDSRLIFGTGDFDGLSFERYVDLLCEMSGLPSWDLEHQDHSDPFKRWLTTQMTHTGYENESLLPYIEPIIAGGENTVDWGLPCPRIERRIDRAIHHARTSKRMGSVPETIFERSHHLMHF